MLGVKVDIVGKLVIFKVELMIYDQFGFAVSYISQKPFLYMAFIVEQMRNLCYFSPKVFTVQYDHEHRSPGRLQLVLTLPCPTSCSSVQMLPWWTEAQQTLGCRSSEGVATQKHRFSKPLPLRSTIILVTLWVTSHICLHRLLPLFQPNQCFMKTS